MFYERFLDAIGFTQKADDDEQRDAFTRRGNNYRRGAVWGTPRESDLDRRDNIREKRDAKR